MSPERFKKINDLLHLPFNSLYEDSGFNYAEQAKIWDFYVTKRSRRKRGKSRSNSDLDKTKRGDLLFQVLVDDENIDRIVIQKESITQLDLKGEKGLTDIIENCSKRIILTKYEKESKYNSLLRHIRNSLAHGLTYFVGDEVFMVDEQNNRSITAVMCFPKHLLLEWISILENGQRARR